MLMRAPNDWHVCCAPEAPSKNINGPGSFTTVLSVLPVLSQRASFEFDASEPNIFNDATYLDLVAFIPGNNCAIGATWQVAVHRTKIDAGCFTNHAFRYTRQSHSGGEQPPDVLVSEPRFILPVGRDHGRDVSLREAISQNHWRWRLHRHLFLRWIILRLSHRGLLRCIDYHECKQTNGSEYTATEQLHISTVHF